MSETMLGPDEVRRFWSKVKKTRRGCWLWRGRCDDQGYGIGPRRRSAHRISYELGKGLIPTGKFVCHTCDRPACVRPDHLRIGTNYQNLRQAYRRGRLRDDRLIKLVQIGLQMEKKFGWTDRARQEARRKWGKWEAKYQDLVDILHEESDEDGPISVHEAWNMVMQSLRNQRATKNPPREEDSRSGVDGYVVLTDTRGETTVIPMGIRDQLWEIGFGDALDLDIAAKPAGLREIPKVSRPAGLLKGKSRIRRRGGERD